MKASLSFEALRCLAEIGGYYERLNVLAAGAVRADIQATIQRIEQQPRLNMSIGWHDVRRAVTRRYSYVIYFRILDDAAISILSIRGGAQAQRFPRK